MDGRTVVVTMPTGKRGGRRQVIGSLDKKPAHGKWGGMVRENRFDAHRGRSRLLNYSESARE